MKRLRVGVVGVGHLGREHARVLAAHPGVELVGVADLCQERARAVAARQQTAAFSDYRELLTRADAVTVAAPTVHHRTIASEFLQRGLAVMVEKPLAPTTEDADFLAALAEEHGAILQVGHIERFNPTWHGIGEIELRPKYIRAERMGPYTFRSTDIGVVLDLMIHDLDLILQLVDGPARHVEALGVSVFGRHEDIVNARIMFENGCVADLTASRVSFAPARRMQLWCAEGYVGLDFAQRKLTLVRPTEKLRDAAAVDAGRLSPEEREQWKDAVFGTCLEKAELNPLGPEPLAAELDEFVRCVQNGSRPRVDGRHALAAISLAEAVLGSVRDHQWDGRPDGRVGPFRLEPTTDAVPGPHWNLVRERQGVEAPLPDALSEPSIPPPPPEPEG